MTECMINIAIMTEVIRNIAFTLLTGFATYLFYKDLKKKER